MRTIELFERASMVIYHYTNIFAGLKIVESGVFELSSSFGSIEEKYGPKGYPYFLSCTRTIHGGYHNIIGDSAVMFVLDGNYYNSRYKSGPIDYWGDRHNDYGRPAEAEDRIYSKTPQIPCKGITAIHLYVEQMDAVKRQNWGAGRPAIARKLLIAAKIHGIKTYFYNDKQAWRMHNTSKCVPITKDLETVQGTVKNNNYYRARSYIEPWLEVCYKDNSSVLTAQAGLIAHGLAYDSDYYIGNTIKGLSNEFANARKPGAGKDREIAVKLISHMQRNGMHTIAQLVQALQEKWKKITEIENQKADDAHRVLESGNNDPILQFINDNSNLSLLGGNCGVLAIALNEKFEVDKFVYVENDAEPDRLYHVAVVKNNKIYDGNGIITKNELRAYGFDDDYAQNKPKLNVVVASTSEYRYIMKGTEPTITLEQLL